MSQKRRKQVFTPPSFDNRVFRQGKIKGFSKNQRADLDMNDPQQFARAMRDMGAKMGPNGEMVPTQNWGGLMGKASQQMNSLSRDARAGEGSGLGGPANTMYDRDPTFFNRGGNAGGVGGFGQMLAQTREQRIVQAQQDGTFGIIRDKFNLDNQGSGTQMNEFGNMVKNAGTPKAAPSATGNRPVDKALIEKRGFDSPVEKEPAMGSRLSDMMGDMGRRSGSAEPAMGQRSVTTPAPTGTSAPTPQMSSQQLSNRKALEDRAAGLRLLREMSQTPLQKDTPPASLWTTLEGQYGEGYGYDTKGAERPAGYEGDVNGRGFAETMQGLANKQVNEGTWREGERLPQGMTAEQAKKTNEEARQKILSRQRIAAKTK